MICLAPSVACITSSFFLASSVKSLFPMNLTQSLLEGLPCFGLHVSGNGGNHVRKMISNLLHHSVVAFGGLSLLYLPVVVKYFS